MSISRVSCKIDVRKTVEALSNKGIKLIEAVKFPADMLAGLNWNLESFLSKEIITPNSVNIFVNGNQGRSCVEGCPPKF